jgi:hypothetical protein
LTEAPTYIWCHDLFAPGIEHHEIYHRVLALSPFHKGFLKHLFAIPDEKIIVSRNGIDTTRWEGPAPVRNPHKVVFTSSPDRGLDRAIQVHGALGITDDTLLSFWYRHERGARIYDGPDEVHKSVLAKSILKSRALNGGI